MYATNPSHSVSLRPAHGRDRRAFSLTELMVVIAIIVLLIGLLLVALAAVRKKTLRTDTEATMTQFANACAAFWAEHGQYPGVIPDGELAAHAAANGGVSPISSTENALLHLMGNYRLLTPQDTNTTSLIYQDFQSFSPTDNAVIQINGTQGLWQLKVKTKASGGDKIAVLGDGPVINGKPYPPYFTPGPGTLVVVAGQVGEDPNVKIPDLVDNWGQPILYLRQSRDRGPLAFAGPGNFAAPQFDLAGLGPYLNSQGLGEMGQNQRMAGNTSGSILTVMGDWLVTGPNIMQRHAMSTIISHPAFYKPTAPLESKARGSVILISAGPDGIYFSAIDGPGTTGTPLNPANVQAKVITAGPKVIEEFDDVRVFQGG